MPDIQAVLNSLESKNNLTREQVEAFVNACIADAMEMEDQKRFLIALNKKGYTADEVAYFVETLYEKMPVPLYLPNAIDICGTGGSGLKRINTSTISAFVLAAAGVPIAKHGNKAASGRFGSFDLLEALGIDIMNGQPKLESIFSKQNLAFIYARAFHPIMKHFGPVRMELGVKTIFNILGPLLNPSNTPTQVVGTSNPNDMELIIHAAKILGKQHFLVLNGSNGLDEVTLTGETYVRELKDGEIDSYTLNPEDFGFEKVDFQEIAGGDSENNVRIADEILLGKCRSQHLNLVLANTALILKFMGKVEGLKEGVKMAQELIESGKAQKVREEYVRLSHLPDILGEIVEHKLHEITELEKKYPFETVKKEAVQSDRNFKAAFEGDGMNVIAEIKYSSPSDSTVGELADKPENVAKIYELNGAKAISVLTDEKYFNGSLENLKIVRAATGSVPLLMKDFVISEYQIYLARYFGADAILLIAALLSPQVIDEYIAIALSLNMDALVEVHDERELNEVLKTNAEIIGVNNRDLHTFEIHSSTYARLSKLIPEGKIKIAESGYNRHNIGLIQGVADGVLVGSTLMKSKDIDVELKTIIHPSKIFKACGLRNAPEAKFAEENKVPLVGINFVSTSHRFVDLETAKAIRAELKNTQVVGVFQNENADKVNQIATELNLDYVQLSGDETPQYCKEIELPIIKTLKFNEISQAKDYYDVVSLFIIDGREPGSGKGYDYSKLADLDLDIPFLIAGGVNVENVVNIVNAVPNAIGIDCASGIETNKEVDTEKILKIMKSI